MADDPCGQALRTLVRLKDAGQIDTYCRETDEAWDYARWVLGQYSPRLTFSEHGMVAYALRRAPMNPPDFTEDDRPAFDTLAERFERAARP